MSERLEALRARTDEVGKAGIGSGSDPSKLIASLMAAMGKFLVLEIDRLEDRVKGLEASPIAYDGVWEAGKAYAKGTFVTFGGSVWHANYKSASKPGDGPAWTLAVKAGRDAR